MRICWSFLLLFPILPSYAELAVVTLVTGTESPYTAGAIALGQSLKDVGSKLTRVVMVTPDVDQKSRNSMSSLWNIVQVEPISCNHQPNLDPTQFDLNGAQYKMGVARWSTTCTKFAAWKLTQFERLIFMDADMLVVSTIDDAIYGYSNASFVAAPETFPPDNFNAGFIVLNPSLATFKELLRLNDEVGSAEGGDQGILNNGLCPEWHFAGNKDPHCGRLPWIYNVETAHYEKYSTLRKMSKLREPAVIHFVADGKPWSVLMLEYVPDGINTLSRATLEMLGGQAMAHVLWRRAFFTASGDTPPDNHILIKAVEAMEAKAGGQQLPESGVGSVRGGAEGDGSRRTERTEGLVEEVGAEDEGDEGQAPGASGGGSARGVTGEKRVKQSGRNKGRGQRGKGRGRGNSGRGRRKRGSRGSEEDTL